MNNQIIVDLSGIKNKDQMLHKLGEVFEFGGAEGNIPVSSPASGKGWGMNWDALSDSLSRLAIGGIWGTSRKVDFPLKVIFKNYHELQESENESLNTLKEILADSAESYKLEDKEFVVEFV